MRKVLYIRKKGEKREEIIDEFEERGYFLVEYVISEECSEKVEAKVLQEVNQILENDFFYFVISFEFREILCKACIGTATKYVVWLKSEELEKKDSGYYGNVICYFVVNTQSKYDELTSKGALNCYYILPKEKCTLQVERMILSEDEARIYNIIDELRVVHERQSGDNVTFRELGTITDEDILVQKTNCYFDKLEEERELSILLKEQLLIYVDGLLNKRSWNAWREIVLWSRRHECNLLLNNFWEFFLLKKCVAIYSEETIQYYENGDIPCVLQRDSFNDLSETYFGLLFLLRRLIYDIAPEEEGAIVDYIMDKKLSVVFIKHVVEHNQIENKEKVYQRLEELLIKYE